MHLHKITIMCTLSCNEILPVTVVIPAHYKRNYDWSLRKMGVKTKLGHIGLYILSYNRFAKSLFTIKLYLGCWPYITRVRPIRFISANLIDVFKHSYHESLVTIILLPKQNNVHKLQHVMQRFLAATS